MTHHLIGLLEIATMFGVSKQRASQLAATADFPVPEATIAAGRIWRRSDVEEWAKRHGRSITS